MQLSQCFSTPRIVQVVLLELPPRDTLRANIPGVTSRHACLVPELACVLGELSTRNEPSGHSHVCRFHDGGGA